SGLLDLLRFQLAKFAIGGDQMRRFTETLLQATHAHLEALYRELMAPLLPLLENVRHLVIVPHGNLHYLPFHAIRAGDEFLCDRFAISYAPSAQMFAVCQSRRATARGGSLIMGIPDQRAPQILAEVQCVAGLLPQPQLLIGSRATAAALREKGPEIDLLHIATHGTYRQDNPMFSSIRLGDGYLNLFDLSQMHLAASLVALSGCATGMNVVAGGDELLGLQRGLLRAGGASLLLSLWDVNDRSAAELMRHFYESFVKTGSAPRALQIAMQELRRNHPHPYFWAPFILVGRITDSRDLSA
ncbi:MAG TPA: CHAT domain-containing protein, partial [Candidatus Acidoferrales bacterium]|nr:CHAT domain-containing protein [Candidatus Acidoferrales bacterium]